MASQADRVVLVLTIAIVLVTATAVFGAFDDSAGGQVEQTERVSDATALDGTDFVSVDDANGENETVYETRGNAVQLTGADDSEVRADADLSLASDSNWTVCQWVRVGNTSAEMDALSANGRVVLGFNGTATNWTLWYYDDSSTNSYQLNTSATTPDQGFTQLCAWQQGDELRFYVNASLADSVSNVSQTNIETAPVNTSNWNGTVEETRTFNEALNASQRNATVTDPTGALGNASRTARIYYDAGAGSRVYVWLADTDATLSNGSWVDGFAQETAADSDYAWERDGPRIRATSGSSLEDQPAAWSDYDQFSETGTAFERVLKDWSSVANLAGALMLVLLAAGIFAAMQRVRT